MSPTLRRARVLCALRLIGRLADEVEFGFAVARRERGGLAR